MSFRRTLPTVAAALLLAPAAADAATYKVVTATHTSSSQKTDTGYTGRSTADWRLAKPSRIAVTRGTGMGQVKATGTYAVDITTSWPGRCAWSAAAGDAQLTVMPDPMASGQLRVSLLGQRASLGNGDLGTECSTAVAGEPSALEVGSRTVPASTFRKKTVTLRFTGATTRDGIAYAWSTKLVLKRLGR